MMKLIVTEYREEIVPDDKNKPYPTRVLKGVFEQISRVVYSESGWESWKDFKKYCKRQGYEIDDCRQTAKTPTKTLYGVASFLLLELKEGAA